MMSAYKQLMFFNLIVFCIVFYIFIFALFEAFFPNLKIDSYYESILSLAKLSWFTGGVFAFSNMLGFILYGHPHEEEERLKKNYKWSQEERLFVVYVSRGNNYNALYRSVSQSAKILTDMHVNFFIEVITDIPISKKYHSEKVDYYVVDEKFQTKKHALYKARALEYLRLNSKRRRGTDWILHLDEESVLSRSAVHGISHHITHRKELIGQGEIKYNAFNYAGNIFITAIDAVRTGDDLGRFRAQFRGVGRPLFGMHGSFILVRSDLENSVTFDLGGKGSVTEDAYFALKIYELGYKFAWIPGYIREQSPFSIKDLIKQRRRWLCGLLMLSSDKTISLGVRIPLMINTWLWSFAWIGSVVNILNLLTGGAYFPPILSLLSAVVVGAISSVYIIGLYRNLEDMNFSTAKKMLLACATFLLMPISSLVEGYACVYALVDPVRGFDIVRK